MDRSPLAPLLESVRLDETFAEAHAALAEFYAVRTDYRAACRHARAAEMLLRHAVAEPE